MDARFLTPARAVELRGRLRQYEGQVRIHDDRVLAEMTILGHIGPASAVGDAAQWLRYAAIDVGLREMEGPGATNPGR